MIILLCALDMVPMARAQNPRFQNPSLDSNCYFPQIGVPGEIDTIYGSYSGEGLGAYIHNLGPKPDGSFGNMLIGNGSGGDVFEQAPTGPNFDLHNLQAIAQSLNVSTQDIRFGHFRDQSHHDIFDQHNWVIFWADDNGNYSVSRYTQLRSNIQGVHGLLGDGGIGFTPYLAHLTSDSIDDIVLEARTANAQIKQDSFYLLLFRGNASLMNQTWAYEDTSINCGSALTIAIDGCQQGDFRGTGRDDVLIADDSRNLFIFKNDPPFSLDSLRHAMFFDTLWSRSANAAWRDNSQMIWPDQYETLAMHALPKRKGGNSLDWVVSIPTTNDSNNGIFIFRGGPNFGSHRITIDSAAFVITAPKELGETNWPDFLSDAGDMTGTGNHVLYVAADNGIEAFQNFYLTGQALDNRIDIYNSFPAGALLDTLTANGDSLEDNLLGLPGYTTDNDRFNGKTNIGSMWVLYGSKQIPMHLNPAFVDVKRLPPEGGAALSFFPNPATQGWSVATIVWPEAEIADYEVYNLLGEVVQTGTIQMFGGPDARSSAEQERIYFPRLANGVYEVLVHSRMSDHSMSNHPHEARAKLVLAR